MKNLSAKALIACNIKNRRAAENESTRAQHKRLLAEKGERNLPLIRLIFPLTPSRSATRKANHLFVRRVFI